MFQDYYRDRAPDYLGKEFGPQFALAVAELPAGLLAGADRVRFRLAPGIRGHGDSRPRTGFRGDRSRRQDRLARRAEGAGLGEVVQGDARQVHRAAAGAARRRSTCAGHRSRAGSIRIPRPARRTSYPSETARTLSRSVARLPGAGLARRRAHGPGPRGAPGLPRIEGDRPGPVQRALAHSSAGRQAAARGAGTSGRRAKPASHPTSSNSRTRGSSDGGSMPGRVDSPASVSSSRASSSRSPMSSHASNCRTARSWTDDRAPVGALGRDHGRADVIEVAKSFFVMASDTSFSASTTCSSCSGCC